jgi:hypothetical protein
MSTYPLRSLDQIGALTEDGHVADPEEFGATTSRVVVLQSRLADSEVRKAVGHADDSFRALTRVETGTEYIKASKVAQDALDEAIRKLGELVREPPSA